MCLNNFPDLVEEHGWGSNLYGISQVFVFCTVPPLDYLFNNRKNKSAELWVFLLILGTQFENWLNLKYAPLSLSPSIPLSQVLQIEKRCLCHQDNTIIQCCLSHSTSHSIFLLPFTKWQLITLNVIVKDNSFQGSWDLHTAADASTMFIKQYPWS